MPALASESCIRCGLPPGEQGKSSLQDELFVLGCEMLCQRHIEAIIREWFMLKGESVHSRT